MTKMYAKSTDMQKVNCPWKILALILSFFTVTFVANSLDPDQDPQNVSKLFDTLIVFLFFF